MPLVQLLDVSINLPFKQWNGHLWEHWMIHGEPSFTPAGHHRAPTKEILIQWLVKVWDAILSAMIEHSFKKCDISNNLDGTDDDIMFEGVDPVHAATVQISVAAILATDSAAHQEELQAMSGAWDGEKRAVSRHAQTLVQLDRAGHKIRPSGWKCEECEMTDNLWLNLTDGTILCGRKFWDGSGGNNHAVKHYEQVKYPLAVKLGTITPDGAGE
ncbi:Ubiquitin carboxyl-terminal hydrolase 5 [Lamellibrachia satsuma]|nr:Ubiquitin carboxyl-terminal hydrolase 5 [Lamellibrachia satsuma]